MRSENETGQREGIKSSINDLLRSWPEMLMSEEEGNQRSQPRARRGDDRQPAPLGSASERAQRRGQP